MIDSLLADLFRNQTSILLSVGTVLVACAWIGIRLGIAARRRNPDGVQVHSGSLQGAVLGLLGLLLGFSFAMAVGRYDNRRSLVVQEANSIGTTWLRTDFLDEPARQQSRDLLKQYTRLRLDGFKHTHDAVAFAADRDQVANLQAKLWELAGAAARKQSTPVVMGYVASLNETIDLDASRMAASRNHVPGAVWLMLVLVGGCGTWANGYSTGASGVKSAFTLWIFPLLIAIVITLIADIDSPHRGLIGMSQKPLQELLDGMER